MIGLEHAVLITIFRRPNSWGTAIAADMRQRGYRTSDSAIYTALARLEAKKLISAKFSPPTFKQGGRSKTLYTLTAKGRIEVNAAAALYGQLTEGLNIW